MQRKAKQCFLLCAAFAFIAVRVKRLKQQTLPLMGDASRVGHKDKDSQTALITFLPVSPCHNFPHKTGLLKNAPTRDASPPLEVAFAA